MTAVAVANRPARAWDQTATAVANASGVASVSFQSPLRVGGLRIVAIDLRVTGSVAIPECTATLNGQVLAVKRAGDRGQLIGEGDVLYMGQVLVLTWTACTAGAVCEATLQGVGS